MVEIREKVGPMQIQISDAEQVRSTSPKGAC